MTNGGTVVGGGNHVRSDTAPAASARRLISGLDSRLTVTGNLYVANAGNGTLTIQNGGQVTIVTGSSTIGSAAGSVGTVTVDGVGSLLNVTSSGYSFVGNGGNGTLNVQNQGQAVFSGTLDIGASASRRRVRSTSAAPTRPLTANNLRVGDLGNGTLTVQDQGRVSITNIFYIGLGNPTGSSNSGTLTVTGAGSIFSAAAANDRPHRQRHAERVGGRHGYRHDCHSRQRRRTASARPTFPGSVPPGLFPANLTARQRRREAAAPSPSMPAAR